MTLFETLENIEMNDISSNGILSNDIISNDSLVLDDITMNNIKENKTFFLTSWANVIKHFRPYLTSFCNKLECPSLARLSSLV
jgi:hypothetical protein